MISVQMIQPSMFRYTHLSQVTMSWSSRSPTFKMPQEMSIKPLFIYIQYEPSSDLNLDNAIDAQDIQLLLSSWNAQDLSFELGPTVERCLT